MRTNRSTTSAIVIKSDGTKKPLLIPSIVNILIAPFPLSIPPIILALLLGSSNQSFFCDALTIPSQSLPYITHQLHVSTTFNAPSIKIASSTESTTTISRVGNTRTALLGVTLGWSSSPPLSSEEEKHDIDSNRIYRITEFKFRLEDRNLLNDINTILARYEPALLKSLSSSLYNDNIERQRQEALLERDRRCMIAEKNITFRSNLQIKNLVEKSKREQKHQQHRIHACHTAEHILNLLEQIKAADTITYNGVINAYAKSNLPDSAQRAKAILLRMEKIHREQLEMLRRLELEAEEGSGDDLLPPVKPNVRSYSNVIDAYSRIAGVDNGAAKTAQSILEHLSFLYKSSSLYGTNTRDEELKPNIISYNSVLNAWAKTGTVHGAMMAAKLLEEMEIEMEKNKNSSDYKSSSGVIADVISYNAVIHAWARCGSEDSGERAEEILRRMESAVKEGQRKRQLQQRLDEQQDDEAVTESSSGRENIDTVVIHPNTRTYSSVIDAWSRSNHPSAARRAHQILDEMERKYAQTGNSKVRPNTVAYSTVINAYARSRDMESKARSALGVLKKMERLYRSGENVKAKPTIVSYNSVLNACASTYGLGSGSSDGRDVDKHSQIESCHHQLLVLDIVKRLYCQIISPQSEVCADHFTYGTVLKACANLTLPRDNDDGIVDFIHQVFSRCCEDGQVSFGVCFQLRQAAPYFYRELIPPEAMDVKGQFIMSRLPPKWCRNVKEKKRFPRKKQQY